jgi:8-oxo-dGTP diphosphatase
MLKAGMAAICFILDGDQMVVMQQAETSFAAGRWSVVGGKVEPGETPEEGMRREVWEESGLTLTQVRPAGHVLLYDAEAGGVTSLSLFVATGFEGGLRGSEEGEPVWWPLDQVDQLNLVEYLRLLLPHVLAPRSLVMGTMRIGRQGALLDWSLERHTVAESVAIR